MMPGRRTPSADQYGVRCPGCHGKESRVLEAREGRGYVRRRHLCLSSECASVESVIRRSGRDQVVYGRRWTTYEFFSPRPGTILVPPDTRVLDC